MDGLDNSFSLADITLKKHIPWVSPLMTCRLGLIVYHRMVRELTNEVLIDIPYFMRQAPTFHVSLLELISVQPSSIQDD